MFGCLYFQQTQRRKSPCSTRPALRQIFFPSPIQRIEGIAKVNDEKSCSMKAGPALNTFPFANSTKTSPNSTTKARHKTKAGPSLNMGFSFGKIQRRNRQIQRRKTIFKEGLPLVEYRFCFVDFGFFSRQIHRRYRQIQRGKTIFSEGRPFIEYGHLMVESRSWGSGLRVSA